MITTHYQNLKHFAEDHEGVVNGAMLYDRHLMQALFQLQIGNPGSSFAVEIARKIGLPEDVIADASDIVGSEYINADKYLQDIVRDKRYWEGKRQTIRQREKHMEDTIARYQAEMDELQKSRKEIIKQAKEEAERMLQESNARIENTIRTIKEAQAEKEKKCYMYLTSLADKYLYDPNSPMRNEELYISVLDAMLKSPILDDTEKIRPKARRALAQKNRIGTKALDFTYTLANGKQGTLYALKAPYTLLFINNPGCHACNETIKALKQSPTISPVSYTHLTLPTT